MRNGLRVIDTDCHQIEPPVAKRRLDAFHPERRAPRLGDWEGAPR